MCCGSTRPDLLRSLMRWRRPVSSPVRRIPQIDDAILWCSRRRGSGLSLEGGGSQLMSRGNSSYRWKVRNGKNSRRCCAASSTRPGIDRSPSTIANGHGHYESTLAMRRFHKTTATQPERGDHHRRPSLRSEQNRTRRHADRRTHRGCFEKQRCLRRLKDQFLACGRGNVSIDRFVGTLVIC